jgi:hypothetical protein
MEGTEGIKAKRRHREGRGWQAFEFKEQASFHAPSLDWLNLLN